MEKSYIYIYIYIFYPLPNLNILAYTQILLCDLGLLWLDFKINKPLSSLYPKTKSLIVLESLKLLFYFIIIFSDKQLMVPLVPKVTLVLKVHEVPQSARSHSLWLPVWNHHAETHAQMKLKAEYLSSLQSELREILKVFPMGCMIERDVWLQLTVEVDRAMGRSKGLLWRFAYLMIICLPVLFLFSLISSDWI